MFRHDFMIFRLFSSTGVFEDEDVIHVEGDVDPVRDLDIIFDELRLKDLEYLNKQIESMERTVLRGADKSKKAQYVSSIFLKHIRPSNAFVVILL